MASPDAVSSARELGVCEPGEPGSLALLGPGDHAAPYLSGGTETRHHKANRLAYFSSHLFDAASIYGSGVEDHAGIAAPLSILTHRQSQRKSVMCKRLWSRSCSQKKRRKRKLCLDGLYFLYLFCAFLCPREIGVLSVSALERMAGTRDSNSRPLL